MSHLPLSLMNRFNKTEFAVYKLCISKGSFLCIHLFYENRLVCFLFNIKNDLRKSACDDIPTLFRCPLCTIKEIKKIFPLCPDSHFAQEQFKNCIAQGKDFLRCETK